MSEKACSNATAWLAKPETRGAMLCVAITAVVAVALVNRFFFLLDRGGGALDQLAWAKENFLGGITDGYFSMRDLILSWKAEARLWIYLPGYPFFLAVLYWLDIKDLAFIRLTQIAVDSLAIFPLYFVFFRLGKSAYLAIFGCLVYAAAPWWSVGSTYLLAESLLPALVISLLAVMTLIRDHSARNLNWFLLGLLASVLPFFRSEMVLLFGPLALWALLVAPKGKRIRAAACVVAGFAFPLILWAIRNDYVHGQLVLTPPAKWYAAWSGLGQVGNDYGYFVSDAKAITLLKSKGITYHSLEAESYWFGEYKSAWLHHPDHVIRTILFRFWKILGGIGTEGSSVSGYVTAYTVMAVITPVALIWLLHERRIADAFLIAWPMGYALGSLGILYVEQRYVRYAGLTYLLALPIALGKAGDILRATWSRQGRLIEPQRVVFGIAAIGFLVLITGVARQLAFMRDIAQGKLAIDRLDANLALEPTSALADIAFRPAASTVQISRSEAGLELQANETPGLYLLRVPVGARGDGLVVVSYRAALRRGAIGFGVLSAAPIRWLSHYEVAGEADKTVEGTFISAVQVGSQFVIDAQGTKPGVAVLFSKLEWTLVCPKPMNLLSIFLSKASVQVSDCQMAQ